MPQKLFPLLLAILVSGCAADRQGSNTRPDSGMKVALLSPGSVNDQGWNALGYAGLKAVEKELGATVSQKQTTSPEFERDFRDYASQGYDVIIGHGFELQPSAIKVSKDFPDVVFVITAGNEVQGRVVPIIPKLEEATYLMGVLAARMSKTHRAGLVGGMEIPPIKSTFEAFKQGAQSADPSFSVRTAFIGNWEDTATAKEATLTLINQGCDFIFQNADAAGRGAIQACSESGRAWAFGSNSDQNSVAPEAVLASAVLEIPRMFVDICRSVEDRTFEPREFPLTIANGHTSLVYNPQVKSRIPESVLSEVESLRKKIIAGTLKVERSHF